MMYATLNGEVRQVVREHRGVIWCPFCDRSSQISKEPMWCDGCHGQFSDKLFDWLNTLASPFAPVRLAAIEIGVLPTIKSKRKPRINVADAVL